MSWSVYDYHDSVHVVPDDDKDNHYLDADCHCGVKYQEGVYVHTSFDGRELLENLDCEGSA